ncbi:MAG: hypothetical protein CTY25_04030 [Methylobacterium sp.]|nr:MAG: hypothetical protein CTY25_04030 [Methylobacterium sp.]
MSNDKEARPIRDAALAPLSDGASKATLDRPAEPVGYKKPPVPTRFQKGQSGNPAGRPKGSGKAKAPEPSLASSSTEIRQRFFSTPVKIRDGEGVREVPLQEAIMRNLSKIAFGGGVMANRLLLEFDEATQRAVEADYHANKDWIDEQRRRFEQITESCRKTGEPIPDWIPRPEDMSCSRKGGLRVIGPYGEESLQTHLLFKRWRDALHIKMIYDESVFFSRETRKTLTMAEFFVMWIDRIMPARWKLASKEMQDRTFALICSSRPTLIRKLEEAFAPLGCKPPLKKPMPPMPEKLLRQLGVKPREVRMRFNRVG